MPTEENTSTDGNHFNVPLLPGTSNKAMLVNAATKQAPSFLANKVFFIKAILRKDAMMKKFHRRNKGIALNGQEYCAQSRAASLRQLRGYTIHHTGQCGHAPVNDLSNLLYDTNTVTLHYMN
jgi:hypothetical protein